MPFIQVEAGKISKEQKEELIQGLTQQASKTLGISEEAFIVLIKENEMDNWGRGGQMLSKVLGREKD